MSAPVPLTAAQGGISRLRIKGAALKNTLYDLLNGYVTMQGTIKVRGGTARQAQLSKTTKGLISFQGVFHTFAHTPTTVPTGYQCHVLVNPSDSTLALKLIHFVSPFMGFLYVVAEFTDGSIWHYWLQTNGAWTANTVFKNGDYVSPTVDNGYAYAATRLAAPNSLWQANAHISLNQVVEPTTYNGFMYKAIAISGDSHTGAVEPLWPTTENATIQEFGDFSDASTASSSTTTSAQQPGSAITDRYGNPAVFSSQLGTAASSEPTVTAAQSVTTWKPGTLYQPGAVVQPSTGQGAFVNAIPNGDFESGDDGNWNKSSGSVTIQTTNPYQGTQCAKFALTHAETATLTMNTYGTVTAGQSVTASAYLFPNNNGTDTTMWLILNWYDSGDVLLSSTQSAGIEGNAYKQAVVTGTAPAGATRCRVQVKSATGTSPNPSYADLIAWNLETPAAVSNFLYEAVQASAATSGSTEPTWPTVDLATVVDGGVTWEAVGTSIITWEAIPIMKSGGTEPTWPLVVGGAVADGTMSWVCADRRITDPKCPQSKYVAISSSKIFAGDNDIIAFCATTNPLDWSSANDAGFLPFGLQNYGSEPVRGLNIYRSNLVAFNGLGYQMWQTDEDPTNMAILDAAPVGCTYSKSIMPVNNDLCFLNVVGIRNVGIAGSNANLQSGSFGKAVDPLVKRFVKNPVAPQEPRGLFYPGSGQYWLSFARGTTSGCDVIVLTINGGQSATSWSRFSFPYEITDWTVEDGELYLRVTDAGLSTDLVWKYVEGDVENPGTLQDDYYCDPSAPVLSGALTYGAEGTANLNWTAASSGDGTPILSYSIYNADSSALLGTVDGSTLAFNAGMLSDFTAYHFYVSALAVSGGTDQSNTIALPTGGPQPVALAGTLSGVDSTDVTLTWSAGTTTGSNVTGYKVYDASTGDLLATIADPATLTWSTTISSGGSGSWFVTTTTATAESAQSNTVELQSCQITYTFTSSGTFTMPAGANTVDIYVIGGGAGGTASGCASVGITGQSGCGGAGGNGAVAMGVPVADIVSPVPVTVGIGGGGGGGCNGLGVPGSNSSFGTYLIANGGAESTNVSTGSVAHNGTPYGSSSGLAGASSVNFYQGGDGTSSSGNTHDPGNDGGAGNTQSAGGGASGTPGLNCSSNPTGQGGVGAGYGGNGGSGTGAAGSPGALFGGGGAGGTGCGPAAGGGGDGADGVVVVVVHLTC